ncbi:MAG: GldG family protein [Deltaproteobacteria bacterium]|nr:GldG family protein [Deltaproteobacteria bacterium]
MSGQENKAPAAMGGHGARAGSNVAISIVAGLAVLIMINYLGMRHYVRADWTASGLYTLSDKSVKVLGSLPRDVQLYVLWSQGDPRYPDVKEILDRYTAASRRLKIEILDPDQNPDRVKMIIDKYGAKLKDMGGGVMAVEASVIVTSGDNVKFVSSADFEDVSDDMTGEGGEQGGGLSGFKAEQALTGAILHVTSDEQQKICFTQGHGEWTFEGAGDRALGPVTEGLAQDGYKTLAVTAVAGARIPEGCRVVAVVGPEKAFGAEEAAVLEAYLGKGGRLLLLLDPLLVGERLVPTGLEQLTAKHGIGLDNDVIVEVDARRLVTPSPLTFVASEFGSHASVKQLTIPDSVGAQVKEQLGAYPVVFSLVRSLSPKDGGAAVADVLARSSAQSWGETDAASLGASETPAAKGADDVAGPCAVAMAAAVPAVSGKAEGRLVVVGDSDFLAPELAQNESLYNRDFWAGLVGWLAARTELVAIAPKNPEHVRLALTEGDVSTLWQVLAGEVLLAIVAGFVVWLRRRS